MPDRVRRSTDVRLLSDEQRDLLARIKAAAEKSARAKSSWEGSLAARDDLVRQGLDAGIGEKLLANETGINRGMLWKIHKRVTTQEAMRRRQAGEDS